ncbi:hypothetical protein ACOJCM_11670 [Billgrantia sp. LNSP4103-1]|uniref:hypothetical protein n=1 Tax=Billgrantia sp. LNSP4103-1 TaxID=3410266 RepID=UPI00403F0F87
MPRTTSVPSPCANNAPEQHQHQQRRLRSNAERARLWQLNLVIGQHLCPVTLPLESISLKNWARKTLRQTFDGHSLSLELRLYFMTLYYLVSNTAGGKLAFLTVNFSQSMTDKLAREAARAPATKHADLVNKRLKKLGIDARWFGVLEDHRGNLHTHCVVAYHQDDEQAVKACFGQDTDLVNSGYRLQHTYKQRCKAMTKPHLLQQHYPHQDALGKYRHAQIDVGVADYMSKALEKPSRYMDAGKCRIYASKPIRCESSERYERARMKQQRITSAKTDLSGLTVHQALSYLLHGWIPEVDPEDDRRHEQHASEIDELIAWDEFRNSSPAYDWQYEENDAELHAYREAERWTSTEPSERDYDQIVSEATLQARHEWNARQPTEREYDQLILEVEAFLGQRHWARCLPEVDPDVSDDVDEAFSELVELIAVRTDVISAASPFTLEDSAAWPISESCLDQVISRPCPVRPDDCNETSRSSKVGCLPLGLYSTLQNARRRPWERRERRGIDRRSPDARTRLRRALTRYRADSVKLGISLTPRCVGPPLRAAKEVPSRERSGIGKPDREELSQRA